MASRTTTFRRGEPEPPLADREEVCAALDRLEAAADELRRLDAERLIAAWDGAVEDMASSPEGVDAGLQALLEGVRTPAARDLLRTEVRSRDAAPGLVILPSNLPGLAVQAILPALAVRRPLLVKSSRAERLFAPAFVDALARREPAVGRALAAVTWRGGDESIESAVLPRVGRVVAYGDDGTMESLGRRLGDGLVARGAKISLAVFDLRRPADEGGLPAAVEGLARDIALFDQRGCLSPHALAVVGETRDRATSLAGEIADALATELAALASRWPPGEADPGALAAVRSLRDEAVMRGLRLGCPLGCPLGGPRSGGPEPGLRQGTVLVEPADGAELAPSPGLRTVRLYPMAGDGAVESWLRPWSGRIQGVAVHDAEARQELTPALRRLGATWIAAPGQLQRPDAGTWANGGLHPIEVFA